MNATETARREYSIVALARRGYHQRIAGLLLAAMKGPEALREASDRPEVEMLIAHGWLNQDESVNWTKVMA